MYKLLIVLAIVVVGLAGGAGTEASAQHGAAAKATPTATPASTATYTMTDLGSLGYGVSLGLAINATGQVTGYSYSSTAFQVTCPPQKYGQPKQCVEHPYHAFLYSNGTMTDLGTLGGHFSRGYAINASGAVAGTADTKSGPGDSFLWNGKTMADIGTWSARGINDTGEITGTCGPDPGLHACLYTNGTLTELPQPAWFTPINCGAARSTKAAK
jgi:probable HAF family extracellular repeat protein